MRAKYQRRNLKKMGGLPVKNRIRVAKAWVMGMIQVLRTTSKTMK
jgi:hypothetical protein